MLTFASASPADNKSDVDANADDDSDSSEHGELKKLGDSPKSEESMAL